MQTHPCNCSLGELAWRATRLAEGQSIVHGSVPFLVELNILAHSTRRLPRGTAKNNGRREGAHLESQKGPVCSRAYPLPLEPFLSSARATNLPPGKKIHSPGSLRKPSQSLGMAIHPARKFILVSHLLLKLDSTQFLFCFCPQRRWETAGHHPSSHNSFLQTQKTIQ